MEFDWTPRPIGEWRALLKAAPRSTLLQSWPYARTVRRENQLMTKTATLRENDQPVGLFQTQEVALGPLHIVQMHRGPIWLREKPSLNDWKAFLHGFSCAYPRKAGRRRRLMPCLPHTEDTITLMSQFGFRPKGLPYETIWVDLRPEPEELRRQLKQNWRHALGKAEKSPLSLELDRSGSLGDWFVHHYAADRRRRRYPGAPPRFLRTLIREASPFSESWILRALDGSTPVAGMLLLLHGTSATYQAGWTTDAGRHLNAHHLMLWNSMMALKEAGISDFDLGGIAPQKAAGVTRFKQGLNGEHCVLSGLYG